MPKIDSRMPSSPIRTRRIPITKRTEGKEVVDRRAIEAWEMLKRMEASLDGSLNQSKASRGKPRRVAKAGHVEAAVFDSAKAVLEFGRSNGWIA
jgi:hypothetical protein